MLHSVLGGEQICLLASRLVGAHPFDQEVACVERYFGTVGDASGISLGCRFVLCTDSGIPGFYRHAMLDFAYKTSEAVTKGVTDEEDAIKGRQLCLLFVRFLCFHLLVWLNSFR